MKKSKVLVLLPLMGMMLTGCDFINGLFNKGGNGEDNKPADKNESAYAINPVIEGGSEEEKEAILDAINFKGICNKSGSAVTEIYPDIEPNLSEDEGDDILLTTKQITDSGKFVNIEWGCDESQTYFSKFMPVDDYHKMIEVNFQHYGAPNGKLTWYINKATCGDAVCNKQDCITFSANIVNESYKHDNATIAEINKVTDKEKVVDAAGVQHKFASTFDIVDYEYHEGKNYSPYFLTNNPQATEKQYLYYNVKGKVIYTAPDGNWGLLADGKQVLEFYIGAGKALTKENWPNLAKEYVSMSGNMGQYCGNIQMGFMTKIKEIAKNEITEPVLTYPALTESEIASWKVEGYTAQKQAIDGFSGSLRSVTGTLVPGSIKNQNGDVLDASSVPNKRFTFQLQVGDEVMTVAYDYHVDRDGKLGVYNAYKAALQKGGQMTVKGTMRYSGNDDQPFITEGNNGVWTIVPFEVGHIA